MIRPNTNVTVYYQKASIGIHAAMQRHKALADVVNSLKFPDL